jgi:hypothetical protein
MQTTETRPLHEVPHTQELNGDSSVGSETPTRTQIEARLAELERDFERGQRGLADLQLQEAQLRETLLRIDGAMQVLRELLGNPAAQPTPSEPV